MKATGAGVRVRAALRGAGTGEFLRRCGLCAALLVAAFHAQGPLYRNLGALAASQGHVGSGRQQNSTDDARAVSMLIRALDVRADDFPSLRLMTSLSALTGQIESTRDWGQRALAARPSNPIVGFRLGTANDRLGRRSEAVAAWRAAGAAPWFLSRFPEGEPPADRDETLERYRVGVEIVEGYDTIPLEAAHPTRMDLRRSPGEG